MVFAKVVKNRSYFKRFQVKFKRRRQCKTDYYARKRLIFQDKNKYNTPKYRLIVRATNRKVIAQIAYSKLQGDVIICQATSAELENHGVNVGLTNYAAAYCTGLLLARRILRKYKLDEIYVGAKDADGKEVEVEEDDDKNSFRCNLDVGLKRTSTGANLFGVLKGAIDGGLSIPYSNKRFPGFKAGEDEEYNADEHRDRIFGKHVSDYMKLLKKEDNAKYSAHFSKYLSAGINEDNIEEMYTKAHKSIRNDPNLKMEKKKKKVEYTKYVKKQKVSNAERKNKVNQKKEAFLKKLSLTTA